MKSRPRKIQKSKVLSKDISSDQDIDTVDIKGIDTKITSSLNSIKSIVKKGFIASVLFLFIVVSSFFYDSFLTLSSMMQNSPIFAFVYGFALISLLGVLSYVGVKEYIGYKRIARVDNMQNEGEKLLKNPTKDVYSFASKIIDQYKKSENKEISKVAYELEGELKDLMEDEVLKRVDEKLLTKLDILAKEEIKKYATQTAVSTAVSPVAFVDAILIISRSIALVKSVSKIYGYRANLASEVLIFKKVFALLAFASATDILANHSHDLFGTSILSKLSMHSAQGIANGVLIARIGIGVIKSIRPLPYRRNDGGFLRSLISSISNLIFSKNK